VTAIRNAAGFLEGEGVDHDDCQSGGVAHTPFSAPWRGATREVDKTRLFRYVRNEPEGTPIRKVARDVFAGEGDLETADYQLARRFFARYPEMFKTDRRGSNVWVEPGIGCFTAVNLRQQYASGKTSVGRGDGVEQSLERGETVSTGDGGDLEAGDLEGDGPQKYAKERTLSYLNSYLRIESDSVRRSLLKQLATGKAGTEDKWQVFRRIRGSGDEYLCLPYRTRFNDAGRAGDVRERFEDRLQTAGDRYTRAVVLTLTTDPKEHDGLSAALESLSENKQRLMSWLSTDYQLGKRPANLSVLEFTQSGLPHLHVVLFGIAGGISQSTVSEKWRDYGQGSVVDLRQARTEHDGTQWRLHDDAAGTVTLRQYLGKAIRGLQSVADLEGGDLRERIDAGDVSLWRQALYWATERQYVTCSPSLRSSGDSGDAGLPHVSQWEFVGVSRYGDLPAHVRQSATFGVG